MLTRQVVFSFFLIGEDTNLHRFAANLFVASQRSPAGQAYYSAAKVKRGNYSFVSLQARDDAKTVCAISLVAAILSNFLHESLGHAATALLTGAKSGVLSTVAWSSEFDSRLVAAGGTLANLAASIVFWIALRNAKSASVRWRYFLLTSFAFNAFEGTGYFLFSGFTNFGDWAQVIAGLYAHWLWRAVLVIVGMTSYFGAVLAVGSGFVKYLGVPRDELRRLVRLTFIPYFSTLILVCTAGLLNPLGMQPIRALAPDIGACPVCANAPRIWRKAGSLE